MNEFINKVQKELNKLQKTLEKEGDVLLTKIKSRAEKAEKNVSDRTKDFSHLIEAQVKKLEPAFDKFYKELKGSASKYGIDLSGIEERVKTSTQKAAARLNLKKKGGKKKKKTTTKKKAASKSKASTTAKKKSVKKKPTKKTQSKKS